MPRSSKEQIRIGIIGTGFARRVQLPAFRATPGAQVVAVCSTHRDRAEAAAQEFGIPQDDPMGGIVLLLLVMLGLTIFNVIVVIIGAVKASSGERFRYPLAIRFIS